MAGPGGSLSVTLTAAVAVKPDADAVIVADWVPSGTVASTAATAKVTADCPAGMVTVAGTDASVVSLLESVTTSGWPSGELRRVTVPVAADAPAFSANVAGDTLRASEGSSSATVKSAVALSDSPVAISNWTTH